MRIRLQVNHNNLDAKSKVLEKLKDFSDLENVLYETIKSIAHESNVPLDYLWDWTLKQFIPGRNNTNQVKGLVVRKPALIPNNIDNTITPSKVVDRSPPSSDELNYLGACQAKTLEAKIACLMKIKNPLYWRKLYNRTKSKPLKLYILSNSTDYELADRGLRSEDQDLRIAVIKMVYRHVQAGIRLWENIDIQGVAVN